MANREITVKNQATMPFITKSKLQNAFIIILTVAGFLAFISPFGMDKLTLTASFSYWLFTCTCGYLIYMPSVYYGDLWLNNILSTHWFRVAISTLFASVLMSFVVPVINGVFFAMEVNYSQQWLTVLSKTIVIGGIITFINVVQDYMLWQKSALIEQKNLNEAHQKKAQDGNNQSINKFMALLPLHKRGELYCLEMADHYVKVYTDKGHHLVLMRFKDALELLTDFPGLQTHRSWWVAINSVTSLNKEGRKVSLSLINSLEVPVSKTYLANIKRLNIY